jgi:hypothetical protein
MAEIKLFNEDQQIFKWKNVETFLIRNQYNEILTSVMTHYEKQYPLPEDKQTGQAKPRPAGQPNFLNRNYCLTLEPCGSPIDEPVKPPGRKENIDTDKNPAITHKLDECFFDRHGTFLIPKFIYDRKQSLSAILSLPAVPDATENDTLNLHFDTNGLTVGAVIWLYFYERMGVFKILGALLDDYNYRGKYPISGRRFMNVSTPIEYSTLIDRISTLHRLGISSALRDRICLYQRVLGVSIENNLNIESERNSGFMNTFNRLIDYMLEYYKAKQLAQAIQAQTNPTTQPRSSVATQTSIRDTISVLKQHFEPLQYGRNQINTFLGIATVHATLCLVNLLKSEIGIPTQYERPEEFIPAAYDILVAKRSRTLNESNRFIIHDNCASYGYRLLTDIETINLETVPAVATGSSLDIWLNDVEGWVEGYRNAYSVIPEKVAAIV